MDAKDQERLARLADPTRVYRQLADDSKAARDRAIYDAYQSGSGLREIARASGLSVSTVHRVIVAETAKQQLVTVEEG